MVVSVRRARPSLWYCLMRRSFVVDVQGGHDAIGNDAGAKQAGRGLGNPAVKDQLHLFGPADIEVFANHFFKEDAAGERSVENLGEGEFDLQDGKVDSDIRLGGRGRKKDAAAGAATSVTGFRSSPPRARRRGLAGAWGSAQERMPLSRA